MKIFIEIYHPFYWHKDCTKISYMSVLIIKHVENEGPGLIEYCLKHEKILYQILNLDARGHFPRLEEVSHIVLLGGPMNVYEEDRYPFLREEDLFIRESIRRAKPILGICLGAQLIVKALGVKVFKAPVKEIGWYDVSLTRAGSHDPIFYQLPKTFPVFQWHEDTFEIPKGAKLIVTSTSVPHQAFRYGQNAYGLQFHLEVTEEMIQDWMETYEEGFETSPPDRFSKNEIIVETQIKIEAYIKRGLSFLRNFFGRNL